VVDKAVEIVVVDRLVAVVVGSMSVVEIEELVVVDNSIVFVVVEYSPLLVCREVGQLGQDTCLFLLEKGEALVWFVGCLVCAGLSMASVMWAFLLSPLSSRVEYGTRTKSIFPDKGHPHRPLRVLERILYSWLCSIIVMIVSLGNGYRYNYCDYNGTEYHYSEQNKQYET